VIEALLSLSALISSICLTLYAIREMKRAKASIPKLDDFVKRDAEGQIIIRDDLLSLIDAFGSRIAKSLKMSMLQGLGAQAKIDKGLKGALAQDIVEKQMPLLELAGDVLGFNTKQYISKHPEALGQLLQLAGPYLKGVNLGNLGQGHNSPQGNVGGYE